MAGVVSLPNRYRKTHAGFAVMVGVSVEVSSQSGVRAPHPSRFVRAVRFLSLHLRGPSGRTVSTQIVPRALLW